MANVIHLVIRVHFNSEQPEKEQHFRGLLGDNPLRKVQSSRLTIRFHVNLQAIIRVQQVQRVPVIPSAPGNRVQQLPLPMELHYQPLLHAGVVQYLPLAY